MEFLPSYTSLINLLNEQKNSRYAHHVNYYFTKNTSTDELHRLTAILPIERMPTKSVMLQEFATKGW